MKINVKIINFCFVLHKCGMQTLTLKVGLCLLSLENKFRRRMCGLKRKNLKEVYETCIMVIFVMC
jgi:hypothetical protein